MVKKIPKVNILVIDDEEDLAIVIRKELERYDYKVFSFTDPFLALEHFRLNIESYGLIVTDIRMPKLSGFDFARKAKEIKPQVKIIFMTAFEVSKWEFDNIFPSAEIDGFLQKPFTIDTLRKAVEKCLAKQIPSK